MISEEENRRENTGFDDSSLPDLRHNECQSNKGLFTLSPNIIFTNCCKVNSTIFFGQLPPLELPEEKDDTGGMIYDGEIAYGKTIAPMWIVTSYRLANN